MLKKIFAALLIMMMAITGMLLKKFTGSLRNSRTGMLLSASTAKAAPNMKDTAIPITVLRRVQSTLK